MVDESGRSIAAVTKAGHILSTFTPAAAVLSVRQIAARTGIPRSTTHVLCQTLVATGLLKSARPGYELGPLVLELGAQVIERTGLVRAAEGVIDSAATSHQHELHLGQLTEGWIVYLLRRSGPHRQPMLNRVGQRAAAHLSGCGRAALFHLSSDEVAEHVRRWASDSRQPLPDLPALMSELEQGREQGYIISSTFQPGRVSVAAPVLDAAGRPVGAISVAGADTTFTRVVVLRSGTTVTELARRVTDRLVSGPIPVAVSARANAESPTARTTRPH